MHEARKHDASSCKKAKAPFQASWKTYAQLRIFNPKSFYIQSHLSMPTLAPPAGTFSYVLEFWNGLLSIRTWGYCDEDPSAKQYPASLICGLCPPAPCNYSVCSSTSVPRNSRCAKQNQPNSTTDSLRHHIWFVHWSNLELELPWVALSLEDCRVALICYFCVCYLQFIQWLAVGGGARQRRWRHLAGESREENKLDRDRTQNVDGCC